MTKASKRIYYDWGQDDERVDSVSFTLAKIRARRDEIRGRYTRPGESYRGFFDLFDDGAEFGPDKPEPVLTFSPNVSSYGIIVMMDGECKGEMTTDAFNAIKRLGAEEAEEK